MTTTPAQAQPTPYVWEATHRIYYDTAKPVPIKEMIIALQGLEGVLKVLPKAVTALTGIEIAQAQFLVQSIESGSLVEDFVVKFFFENKENFDAFAERMGRNKMVKGSVIAAAIAGVIGYGVAKVTSPSAAPNITATNSIIIQGGAGALGITPEAFEAAMRAAVTDKKAVAESALKFMAPARAQPGSSVAISDAAQPEDGFIFPAQAVAEVPARIDAALVFKEKGRSRELKPARIYVRRVLGPVAQQR